MAESTVLTTFLVAFVCMVLVLVLLILSIVAVVWFMARFTDNADRGGINIECKTHFSCNSNPAPKVCPSCENMRSGSSIEGRDSTRGQLRQRSLSTSPKTVSSENAMPPVCGCHTEERSSTDVEKQVINLRREVSSIQEKLEASRILTAKDGREAEDPAKFESTGSDPFGCGVGTPDCKAIIPDATPDEIVSVSRPTGRRRSLRSEILTTTQASEFEFSSSSAGNSSDSDARRHGRTSPASEISSTSSRSGHSDASSTDSGYDFYFPRQSFPQPQPRGPEEQEARNPVRVRDSIPPSFTTDDEKMSARFGRDRDENAGAKEQSEAAGLSRSSSCSSMSRPRLVHEPAIEAECLGVNRADVMTDLEEEEEEEEKKEEEEDSDEEYQVLHL